jgi:NAD(P)-dependent dehydrogenase (short-subunit alcohol dehydrogenase family)
MVQNSQKTNQNPDALRLLGQHIVIIGGSSGIGLSVARRAKRAGGELTLVGRNAGKLKEASDIVGGATTITADLLDTIAISVAFARMNRIDHVVVSAGSSEVVPISQGDIQYWRSVLDMRIVAPLHVVKEAVAKMTAGGSITLMSGSLADRPSGSGYAVLSAGVGGIEALTRALALELAPVRVNAISPGMIDTPLMRSALGGASGDYLNNVASKLALKRMGTSDEAAEAILLLITNRYMTAEVLHVDGGMRLA